MLESLKALFLALKALFLALQFSYYIYVNNLPDDVIFDVAIYGDDTSDIFKSFLGILLPAKQVLLERL